MVPRKKSSAGKARNRMLREAKKGTSKDLVLGRLLFLIFTNDMPNCLKNCRNLFFTDDTSV